MNSAGTIQDIWGTCQMPILHDWEKNSWRPTQIKELSNGAACASQYGSISSSLQSIDLEGYNCAFVFVDCNTRYRWIYSMQLISEMLKVVKKWYSNITVLIYARVSRHISCTTGHGQGWLNVLFRIGTDAFWISSNSAVGLWPQVLQQTARKFASPVTPRIMCESHWHSPFSLQQQEQCAGSRGVKMLYPKHTV